MRLQLLTNKWQTFYLIPTLEIWLTDVMEKKQTETSIKKVSFNKSCSIAKRVNERAAIT